MTFANTTEPGNEQLIERIRKRIQSAGHITFAEFMEAALYDPDYGYYTTGRETVGVGGDFVTSPIMHPAFGMTIAHWLESQWQEMGSPKTFDVVEMGAGKGVLSAVILHYFSERNPELLKAVRYRIVEKRSQAEISPQVEILDDPANIQDASINGCVFSNELIDAFPVHLVTVEGGRLREIFVSEKDGRFIEIAGEPSTPKIRRYFERLGIVELPEEYRTEVNLKALEWIKQMSLKLVKGSI
ncbi:MAG TPA: SAM-dependent methyltransferase, partial [Armatimonadota bacterium]